jgi:hypothetical protein
VQGCSGNSLCCPIRAIVHRVKHHQLKKSTPNKLIASYYITTWCTDIKPKDVTDALRHAMWINFHRTGIKATDISAWSLSAGGTIAMLFGNIDMNNIHLMGCWHSYALMWYLHGQAHPIEGRFAEAMYNNGA